MTRGWAAPWMGQQARPGSLLGSLNFLNFLRWAGDPVGTPPAKPPCLWGPESTPTALGDPGLAGPPSVLTRLWCGAGGSTAWRSSQPPPAYPHSLGAWGGMGWGDVMGQHGFAPLPISHPHKALSTDRDICPSHSSSLSHPETTLLGRVRLGKWLIKTY